MVEATPPQLNFLVYELNLQASDFAKAPMQVIPAFIAGVAIVCNIPGLATGLTLITLITLIITKMRQVECTNDCFLT
jgi:heme/copper-type cytochrome/quinol oxidase subunit 1